MDITMTRPNPQAIENTAEAKPETFIALYDHYFPRVYSYLLYRVQDPPLAADLTADTFERALRQWPQYDPARAAVSTWLFAMAGNVLKNYFRWQKIRRWLPLEDIRNRAAPDPQPESSLMQDEHIHTLLAAVAQLPAREREILALKFGASLTNRHIAEVMGLGESHVGVILYRAINKLKEQLGVFAEVNHE